jgi:asparagine synthase (glutamine-hydrolysing)
VRDRGEGAWACDVWDRLNEAIRQDNGLRSDGGVMLSGGVDSSLLALALSERDGEGLPAISIGAPGWENDETEYANDLATRCGLDPWPIHITPEDGILDALAGAIWKLEEPTRFYNAIPLEIACRRLAGRLRGLFTGEGADAILGGRSHERAHWVARLNTQPKWIANVLRDMPDLMLRIPRVGPVLGNLRRLLRRYDSVPAYTLQSFLFNKEIVGPMFETAVPAHLKELAAHVADWQGENQDMLLNVLGVGYCWNERLEKIAAHSHIDMFHPFQTHEMLLLSLQMPLDKKVSKKATKPVIRRLVAEKLSPSMNRRRKIQLSAPMRSWWKECDDLRGAVLDLKDPNSPVREYLDVNVMDQALKRYEAGPVDDAGLSRALFSMLGLDLWLKMFTDSQTPSRLDTSSAHS